MSLRAPLAGLCVLAAGAAFFPARAEIQEYQILRLLSYRTQCRPLRAEARSTGPGPRRFLVACADEVFYPDGAEVLCDDPDDERTCRILTAPTHFEDPQLTR